jgi:hypothetical protein
MNKRDKENSMMNLIRWSFILMFLLLACQRVVTPAPITLAQKAPTATTIIFTPTVLTYLSATSQYLSTPELIDQAFARGEITEEERLLYLAYALYEPRSLPAQFRSNYGWFGEAAAWELDEVVGSSVKLCSMSPFVRSELLRLVKKKVNDTVCN